MKKCSTAGMNPWDIWSGEIEHFSIHTCQSILTMDTAGSSDKEFPAASTICIRMSIAKGPKFGEALLLS